MDTQKIWPANYAKSTIFFRRSIKQVHAAAAGFAQMQKSQVFADLDEIIRAYGKNLKP